MHTKQLINSVEDKGRLVICWLLLVYTILAFIILLTTKANNETISVIITVSMFVFSVIAILVEQHRTNIINLMWVIATPMIAIAIYYNGILPIGMLPIVLMIVVVSISNQPLKWWVLFVVSVSAIYQSLMLESAKDIAMASRLLLTSLLIVSVTLYLKKQYDNLIARLNSDVQTNERIYGTIGHELRTPVATLDMLVNSEIEQPNPNNIREIQRLSTHLLAVLDDMKVATNQSVISQYQRYEPMSVYDTLERALDGIKPLAAEHNIAIFFKAEKQANTLHDGSTKALFQITQNLLKNAILHSGGRSITLMQSSVEIGDDLTRYCINVKDDGKGINQTFKDRMFNAFEQSYSKNEGTGLGLNVCKRIAESMPQGDLRYIDDHDYGANFELTFVLTQNASSEVVITDTDILRNKKILFVEDSGMLRRLARRVLSPYCSMVIDAEDGKDALNKIVAEDFDLVVTDIMMPNCNGYELTRQLRKNGFTKPIIGLTAATVGEEANLLIQCGANAVLAKPFTLDAICAELKKCETT